MEKTHTCFPIMCQYDNPCGNVSFYYSCLSCVNVSRCSYLSVVHFLRFQQYLLQHFSLQLLLHSLELFPLSGFAAKGAKTFLLWDFFFRCYRDAVQLAGPGRLVWAVFRWNRAQLDSSFGNWQDSLLAFP